MNVSEIVEAILESDADAMRVSLAVVVFASLSRGTIPPVYSVLLRELQLSLYNDYYLMPGELCSMLGVPAGTTYAQASKLNGQALDLHR